MKQFILLMILSGLGWLHAQTADSTLVHVNSLAADTALKSGSEFDLDDSTYFRIYVFQDSIMVKHLNHKFSMVDTEKLNEYIEFNYSRIDKSRIVLIAGKNIEYDRIKMIMDLFSKNKFFKFKLITDIE